MATLKLAQNGNGFVKYWLSTAYNFTRTLLHRGSANQHKGQDKVENLVQLLINKHNANMTHWHEIAYIFECESERLLGIATVPHASIQTGILIIVGGPQYRAGSHRQFTLLARQLAMEGIPSFRFDYRGMGDSEGDMRTYENVEADINAAQIAFRSLVPGIDKIVLWGLCDAASAALMHTSEDPRIGGMILLNPWVHTHAAEAKARLRSYYPAKLFSLGFWRKLFLLKMDFRQTLKEFVQFTRQRFRAQPGAQNYIQSMLQGMQAFQGKILIILSSQEDLTVQEFTALINKDPDWRQAIQSPRLSSLTLHGATHTFSSQLWRDQVCVWTSAWLRSEIHTQAASGKQRP